MASTDLFESYLHISMPKDIAFIDGLKLVGIPSSSKLDKLKKYHLIKKQIDDFSSNIDLMKNYPIDELELIKSKILDKDEELKVSFDSKVYNLDNSVNTYSGNHINKFNSVMDTLDDLVVLNVFTKSNANFDSIKQKIRTSIVKKVYAPSKIVSSKNSLFDKLKSYAPVLTLAAGLFVGSYAGSNFFPEKKEVITTIDESFYDDPDISTANKFKQYAIDNNRLSKQHFGMVQSAIDFYSKHEDLENGSK